MSTVFPNDATQLEEPSSTHPAPKKILKSTYKNVLAALQENKRVILITGDTRKGKTALIHTISKDIASANRIITLSGKDLPSLEKSKNSDSELNNMKDFILESTDLEDKLVVTLDDANCLPISFLSEVIKHAKLSSTNGYSLQLILSGPLNFKDQLLAIEQVDNEELIHCPMDSLGEQEIHAYAKNKSYKISSNIKRLEFKSEALHALSDFVRSDQQLLDVILEWCAALAKKDQLTSISSHTVNRAAGFAQQFSKDKNLGLVNSYPPSHEVYKYINDIQSAKKLTDKTIAKVTKKSVKKLNKNKANKPYIKTSKTAAVQETKIPTITSKVEPSNTSINTETLDKVVLQSLHEMEDEIMPPQWTPSSKRETTNTKSFPAMAGLITFLLLGFIAFIAFRIGSDPKVGPSVDELPKEQIALNESENAIIENQLEPEETDIKTNNTEDVTTENALQQKVEKDKSPDAATKPQTSIVASGTSSTVETSKKIEKPVLVTKANEKTTNNGQLAESNVDNVVDKKLNEQILATNKKPVEKTNTIDEIPTPVVEIKNLLVLAEYQFENKKLSSPSGDNALETYQKILAKHPNNQAAVNGVKKVHDRYLGWANYYLKQDDISRAKHFYNKALSIDPSDTIAIANLQNIARQEKEAANQVASASTSIALQDAIPPKVIDNLLISANQNMLQIKNDISENERNYKIYQEAQIAYQDVLRSQPQNQLAIQGLSTLKNYYTDWAELQMQSKNYNIALFLYGQALSIEPGNVQITQRIEQIRELKKSL